MKFYKHFAATVLAFALLAVVALPARGADLTTEGAASAQWLRTACPQPGVGDETVVLALLRGAYITNLDEYTKIYLQNLQNHLEAGGAASQPKAASARQAIVLAAAGIDIAAEAPALLKALEDGAAIAAEGHDALCQSLLLFGHVGVQPPKGLQVEQLLTALAATRNEDGGYGPGGESNGLATAEALQAFTGYADIADAQEALLNARFWLQLNSNYLGGYDLNGASSPDATAAAMLAAACDGQEPAFISMNSASMLDALMVFFDSQQGSFSENPDTLPVVETNALCLLALAAQQRYVWQKTPVFDFSDASAGSMPSENGTVPESQAGSKPAASGGQGGSSATNPFKGLLGLSTAAIIGIAGGGVGLVVLIAVVAGNRSSRKKKRKKKAANSKTEATHEAPKQAKKSKKKKDGKYTYRM